MTLMDAPRSSMACSNLVLPITQGIVKLPGSLHLGGSLRCKTAETFSLTFTTSLFERLFFVVQSSFKNLAYLGTCLIASRSGMLTCTFLNVSRMFFSVSSIFDCMNLRGKGASGGIGLELINFGPNLPVLDVLEGLGALEGCGKVGATFTVASSCSTSSCINVSSSFWADVAVLGLVSTILPLLKVIALVDSYFPFGFTFVELGNLPCSLLNYPMNSAICPICFFNSVTSRA